jgi:adenylosuccinate synthase
MERERAVVPARRKTMWQNVVVVGAQWGDEGKGKIVDVLADHFDIVARYQGGANAGHTVVVEGRKFILQLLPAGVVRPGKIAVIGNGVVVNPDSLLSEVERVEKAGVPVGQRLVVSDRAHLILPYHRSHEVAAEQARGVGKIGTTAKGIGPCYEDKAGRRGMRAGDLRDPKEFRRKCAEVVAEKNRIASALFAGTPLEADSMVEDYYERARRIAPYVTDVSAYLNGEMDRGKRVLFEGAQGTLLDIDHGTYPFVTSSSASAGGACTGTGVGPTRINAVLGVSKAYCTRVGSGPYPTEALGPEGDKLRERGGEYGAVTGRPRRCGWFDVPAIQRPLERSEGAGDHQAGHPGSSRGDSRRRRIRVGREALCRFPLRAGNAREPQSTLSGDAGLAAVNLWRDRVLCAPAESSGLPEIPFRPGGRPNRHGFHGSGAAPDNLGE